MSNWWDDVWKEVRKDAVCVEVTLVDGSKSYSYGQCFRGMVYKKGFDYKHADHKALELIERVFGGYGKRLVAAKFISYEEHKSKYGKELTDYINPKPYGG